MNIELNKKLLEAATKENIDYNEIKSLLKQGADFLGCCNLEYEEYTLEEIIMHDYKKKFLNDIEKRNKIVDLIEFFLSNGFKPSNIKKCDANNTNIMWILYFVCSESAIQILKLFIENGLKPEALEDFISHFYTDTEMDDGFYDNDDTNEYKEFFTKSLNYGLKMVMLSASYPHILNESEFLRSCIEVNDTNKDNNYDLTKFRDYNNYEYELDISTCDNLPYGLRNATVRIREKESPNVVWTLHI